jgi:hypothetical protein
MKKLEDVIVNAAVRAWMRDPQPELKAALDTVLARKGDTVVCRALGLKWAKPKVGAQLSQVVRVLIQRRGARERRACARLPRRLSGRGVTDEHHCSLHCRRPPCTVH